MAMNNLIISFSLIYKQTKLKLFGSSLLARGQSKSEQMSKAFSGVVHEIEERKRIDFYGNSSSHSHPSV